MFTGEVRRKRDGIHCMLTVFLTPQYAKYASSVNKHTLVYINVFRSINDRYCAWKVRLLQPKKNTFRVTFSTRRHTLILFGCSYGPLLNEITCTGMTAKLLGRSHNLLTHVQRRVNVIKRMVCMRSSTHKIISIAVFVRRG